MPNLNNDLDLDFYKKDPISIDNLTLPIIEESTEEEFDQIIEQLEAEIEATVSIVVEQELERIFDTLEGDALIEEMIDELGLLEEEQLTESGVNTVRLSYQAKLKRAETQAAMITAKEAGDILYTKYEKFNKLRLNLKRQIIQKYGARAKIRAREAINRSKRDKEMRPNRPSKSMAYINGK